MAYAATTSVSVEKTRGEIEVLLKKHGASGFAYAWQEEAARIEFLLRARHLRFEIKLPDRSDKAFTRVKNSPWREVGKTQAEERYNQVVRSRWRGLLLIIKAKLEAIEAGVSIFDEEFLAFMVTDNGQTVAQRILPQIQNGQAPRLLEAHR